MAICTACNKKIGILEPEINGLCQYCNEDKKLELQRQRVAVAEGPLKERLDKFLKSGQSHLLSETELQSILSQVKITTAISFSNRKIVDEIDIISSEVVYGMHIFKDLFAGVRDIVGGRSEAVQETLKDAKLEALRDLKIAALKLGANGIIGVTFAYHELSGGGKSGMIMLVLTGTAVKLIAQ